MPKYVIGIDLGTTNCVIAYSPLDVEKAEVHILPIPQLVTPAVVDHRDSLPSFLYLPTDTELQGTDYSFGKHAEGVPVSVAGEIARKKTADVPDRSIIAAKSWLCHSKVDRRQPILPWNAPESVPKISPLTATQRYLEHLIETWNDAFPDAPIAQQEVVITVPASFDAGARELTREAAIAAGLPEDKLVFLEEPQAAIYAWLNEVGDSWRKNLKLGNTLLVCDVGGGTTDLTLVGVEQEDGDLILKRIAVGEHLLVGGDNMDLALAHYASELLNEKGINLDPWQSVSLWHSCRDAKESLFDMDKGGKTYPVSVLGRGKKMIGGTISVDVNREKASDILCSGFFPKCEKSDKPKRRGMIGFKEIGLPFEHDTAITRHLGAFLSSHDAMPTHVLLNGGVFKANGLRQQLFEVLDAWFPSHKVEHVQSQSGLDHSVAFGAAYYGWMKLRGGIRIRSGTAQSYYVGIETAGLAVPGASRPLKALCVAPFGMEEGTSVDVPGGEIGLVVGETAHFRIFSSTVRKDDKPGDVLDYSHITSQTADLQETDSMETLLSANDATDDYVPIKFHTNVTELGIMELWCDSTISEQCWKLEFSVRDDEA